MTPGQDPLVRAVRLLEVRWGLVARAALTGAAGLGSAVALAGVSAWLIARASQMPPVLELSVAAVAVRTFGIARGVLRYLERLASHDVALRAMTTLRVRCYERLAQDGGPGLAALRRGDLLARVGADVDTVGEVVVRSVLPAAVALVVALGSTVALGLLLPGAGAVLAVGLLLAGVAGPAWAVLAGRDAERDAAEARAAVSAAALALLDGAAELTVAGRVPAALEELRRAERRLARATDRRARRSALAEATTPFATGLAVVGALAVGIPATTGGTLTPVELAVVVLTPLAAFEAVSVLPGAALAAVRSREAARRVLALLDGAPPARAPHPAPRPLARVARASGAPAPGRRGPEIAGPTLVATGLGCGYDPREPLVTGLDLHLAPGRSVAVLGPSGAGKTTVLLTLAGLLAPVGGTVRVDGLDPAAAPRADVAQRVSLTTEDAHVFDTTVLENLRVARGDVTPEEAEAVLAQVGLGEWLGRLPRGLDTLLGSDAARVSGGERRRLLVARALLSPAPLLLLDEPTEHLDADGRGLLTALLDGRLAPGRGVVVATHDREGAAAAGEVLHLVPGQDDPAGETARAILSRH